MREERLLSKEPNWEKKDQKYIQLEPFRLSHFFLWLSTSSSSSQNTKEQELFPLKNDSLPDLENLCHNVVLGYFHIPLRKENWDRAKKRVFIMYPECLKIYVMFSVHLMQEWPKHNLEMFIFEIDISYSS